MASGISLKMPATGVEWVQLSSGSIELGNGRTVYVYQRGTSTQVSVYSDPGLTMLYPGGQPLTTGSDGIPGAIPGYVAAEVAIDIVDVSSGTRTQAEQDSATRKRSGQLPDAAGCCSQP
jgi:hypothetical protein